MSSIDPFEIQADKETDIISDANQVDYVSTSKMKKTPIDPFEIQADEETDIISDANQVDYVSTSKMKKTSDPFEPQPSFRQVHKKLAYSSPQAVHARNTPRQRLSTTDKRDRKLPSPAKKSPSVNGRNLPVVPKNDKFAQLAKSLDFSAENTRAIKGNDETETSNVVTTSSTSVANIVSTNGLKGKEETGTSTFADSSTSAANIISTNKVKDYHKVQTSTSTAVNHTSYFRRLKYTFKNVVGRQVDPLDPLNWKKGVHPVESTPLSNLKKTPKRKITLKNPRDLFIPRCMYNRKTPKGKQVPNPKILTSENALDEAAQKLKRDIKENKEVESLNTTANSPNAAENKESTKQVKSCHQSDVDNAPKQKREAREQTPKLIITPKFLELAEYVTAREHMSQDRALVGEEPPVSSSTSSNNQSPDTESRRK